MKTNLGFESEICPENAYYREARDGVFDIFGLLCPRKLDHYRRVPEDVAAATSTSVAALSSNTAGGRLRFRPIRSILRSMRRCPRWQI